LPVFFLPYFCLARRTRRNKSSLATFLTHEGLAAAKLERRSGNHLFIPARITSASATGTFVTVQFPSAIVFATLAS